MTLSTSTNTFSYSVTAVPQAFPFPVLFFKNEHLVVTVSRDEGSSTLVFGSDYSVTGAGDDAGGTVTVSAGMQVGDSLIIQRIVPAVQEIDLRNQGEYLAETIEDGFDYATMLAQQDSERSSRALLKPVGKDYYDANGKSIKNVALPVDDADAATKKWSENYVASALATGQGPANNAENILWVTGGLQIRKLSDKLDELVSIDDFLSLRDALASGAMVRVPATVTSITVSTADSPFVLPNLFRVSTEGDLDILLEGGVHTTAAGNICRVGVRNSTIRILGVPATETKASSVASISGTAGDWAITYNLIDASSFQVGDFAKLYDVGPLPLLMGDNAVSTVLRNYPLKGELYNPGGVNAGVITTTNGSNAISFTGVNGTLSDYMKPGDLFTLKGQTEVLATVGAASATISGTWVNSAVLNSGTFYVTRPSAGTIGTGGVSSATVVGTGSKFLSEGNAGDILLAKGAMTRIQSIASDGSMTLDKTVNLPNGTPYTILQSAACLHAGVHEVISVSGNQVTLRNRITKRPPLNGVTVDEFKCLKTVLKNTGSGDGFVFDQNASLREVNDLAVVGPGNSSGPIGFLLQSRVPSEITGGGISFGDATQNGLRGTVLFGQNVGITRWGRAAMIGHGCLLNARKTAFTNNIEIGVWLMEGGIANLRRAQISSGNIGLAVNAGGVALITEALVYGCGSDGVRADGGATLYGEAPGFIANAGMNLRLLNGFTQNLTDGVSLLAGQSGVYLAGASARIDRMVVGASSRSGIELLEDANLIMTKVWVSGTSGVVGQGLGVNMGNGTRLLATDAAVLGNAANDLFIASSYVNVEAAFVSSNFGTFGGVSRLNSPNANGCVIWDGLGADTGSSAPVIGAAGGDGTGSAVTGSALNWTRDKDRYKFDARVTVTTIGNWTGYLTISLPFTVAAITPISAMNVSNNAVLAGYATGNQLRIYSATGTFPVANGQSLVFSGTVRA